MNDIIPSFNFSIVSITKPVLKTAIIHCWLIALFCTNIFANNINIDSLTNELKLTENDSVRFFILCDIYDYHYGNNNEGLADSLANHILELTNSSESKHIRAKGYTLLADHKGELGSYLDSKNYYQKAMELNLLLKDTVAYSNSIFNLGVTYDYLGDYVTALKYYFQSLDLFEQLNDKSGIAEILSNISVLYSNQLDYENSAKYSLQALEINKALNNNEFIGLNLGNLGAIYHDWSVDSGDSTKQKQALEYYQKGLEIEKTLKDSTSISWIMANIGLLYNELNDHETALDYLQKVLTISKAINDKTGLAVAYGNIGEVYFSKEDYQNTLDNMKRSYQLAVETNDKLLILEAYESFSQVYEKLGNFKLAYEYHTKFKAAQDSLYNVEKNSKFNELIALYETEKKEQEIKNLHTKRQLNELEIEQQKSQKRLYIIIAIFLGLFALSISFFYLLQKQNKEKLEKTNLNLIKSQTELTRLNQTKDRFFAIIAHDIRGALTSFHGIGKVIKNHLEKGRLERINMVADRIDNSANKLNELLDNLLNWAVTQQGNMPFKPKQIVLNTFIEKELTFFNEDQQAKNMKITIDIPEGTIVYADQNGLNVIIRNLLSNAFRFTPHDGTISIKAENGISGVTLFVSDTGMGIPKDKMDILFSIDEKKSTPSISGEKGIGLGLTLTYEFVTLHNGNIEVESIAGKGTTFKVYLPNEVTQS
ncbi:tetratricopeptide repeat protein [Reichenbachiella sp. MALMAid0571]|uniref:tetratricopeptide repeat-containing sensor histidine kinase n=1 Tax=Reichenbachiella sp. MALMAid0571 TaxID=3143939 RepID=UPI0032DF07B7